MKLPKIDKGFVLTLVGVGLTALSAWNSSAAQKTEIAKLKDEIVDEVKKDLNKN